MNTYINQDTKNENKIFQEKIFEQLGVQKSFLKVHNLGSSISEYLEISMPYMIMYKSVSLENSKVVSLEFTECQQSSVPRSSPIDVQGKRPLHSHDFYELTIVLSGEVTIQIEDELITYRAGDCCICNKKILHRELHNQNFELLLFLFKEEYLQTLIEEDVLYDDLGNIYFKNNIFHELFFRNEKNTLNLVKEYIDFRPIENYDNSSIFSILNAILNELSEQKSGRSYLIKGYFCRFIELLSDPTKYEFNKHQKKLKREEELIYEISLLLEKYKGHISNEELAKKLNYNSDYLNRIVKKRVGKSLSEFKRDFLLKEACYLLTNTNLKISEVCETLGYSNRNFFNKVFTQKYGVSPSKFRQSHF